MKMFLALVLLTFAASQLKAQSLFDCACPSGATTTTSTIVICYMGTNYNVDVTFCYRAYVPPADIECDPDYLQDYAIVIKKICPPLLSGIPLNDLIKGTIAAFDVCCGNYFNKSFPLGTEVYCYTYSVPQCWQFVANCWQPCADSKCCVVSYDHRYNAVNQRCENTITETCTPSVTCAIGCTTWNCEFTETCPCN